MKAKEGNFWYDPKVGQLVYLSVVVNTSSGRSYIECKDSPYHTNMSSEFRLDGWVGETDNLSRHAIGAGIVSKINSEGYVLTVRKLRSGQLNKLKDLMKRFVRVHGDQAVLIEEEFRTLNKKN